MRLFKPEYVLQCLSYNDIEIYTLSDDLFKQDSNVEHNKNVTLLFFL